MTSRFLAEPILVLACAGVVATAAGAAGPGLRMTGGMLVDSAGMALYTFDKDVAGSGRSTCNGPCATLWPPATAPADATPDGDFGVVTRDDGTRQWAWKGKPLYRYSEDQKPGEAGGDNFKDVWHLIR